LRTLAGWSSHDSQAHEEGLVDVCVEECAWILPARERADDIDSGSRIGNRRAKAKIIDS
jgi:hypothetical protein